MRKLILLLIHCFIWLDAIEAHPGVGIVMDGEGNVFYTDLSHVWKISPNGTQSIAVRDVHTHELYLDSNGDLYGEHEWYEGEATDKWRNYVWCLSKDGVFEKIISDVEGFLENTTLVRDIEGNTYWAKSSVNGELLMKQTSEIISHEFTSHLFEDIRWMHYSKHDNNLYVVDHLTIKRITATGKVEIVANDLKENTSSFDQVTDRHYVFGLWTDLDNNVYIALYGAKKVKKITSTNEISTVFESEEGWSPCGGLIDKDGDRKSVV